MDFCKYINYFFENFQYYEEMDKKVLGTYEGWGEPLMWKFSDIYARKNVDSTDNDSDYKDSFFVFWRYYDKLYLDVGYVHENGYYVGNRFYDLNASATLKKRRYLKHRRIKALYYELKCLDNEFGKVIEFENTFDKEIKKFLTNKLNFDVVKIIESYFYKIMDDINFDNNSIKEDIIKNFLICKRKEKRKKKKCSNIK